MNRKLTLGSLFDGSGGFPLGGLICGVTPLWASEIEPFPVRVTTKRIPEMKHFGDVSKLSGATLSPVDIITFGSPCQDMSIAGKREGLCGTRSNLFYEAIRIIKEMRCKTNGKYPRFIVWENVPGAFSSNKGEDFKTVLEEICKIKDERLSVSKPKSGKWTNSGEIMGDAFSVCWRVLDAQYWGVPQRRKRIYLVADFAGECADKILFESESLSGNLTQSVSQRKTATTDVKNCIGATGFDGYNAKLTGNVSSTIGANCGMSTGRNGVVLNNQGGNRMDITEDVTCTLRAEAHHPPCVIDSAGFCTEHSAKSRSIGYEKEISPTLRAGTVPGAVMFENHSQDTRYTGPIEKAPTVLSTYGTGGNNQPFVIESSKCFDVRFTSEGTKNARHNCYPTTTARTIDTGGNSPDSNQGGVAVVSIQGSMIGRKDENGPQGNGVNEDVSFTLNATDRHAVSYGIDRSAFNQGVNAKYNFVVESELQPTMVARGPGAVAHSVYSTSKNSYHTIAEKNIATTLVASDFKDPPTVSEEPLYIVRRLTPTECARLQGFPDWWCSGLETEKTTDEEIDFWRNVFNTYAEINGKKPKTDKQIIKWLKNPHTDSAEYKMWGNGVALPCVWFVLCGIVWYAQSGGDNAPI